MDATGVDAVALPTWTLPPRLLSRDDGFSDRRSGRRRRSRATAAAAAAARRGRAPAGAGGGGRAAAGPSPRWHRLGQPGPLLAPPTGAPAVSLPMGFTEAPELGPRGSSRLPGGPAAGREALRGRGAGEGGGGGGAGAAEKGRRRVREVEVKEAEAGAAAAAASPPRRRRRF